MKTFLLAVTLLLSTLMAQAAAQIKITNTTPCDIIVTPYCYDPATCAGGPCGLPPVVVPPFTTIAITPCPCPPPQLSGYHICYAACPGLCADLGNRLRPCPPPGPWSIPAVLPPCPGCDNRPHVIDYDPAGNIIIHP